MIEFALIVRSQLSIQLLATSITLQTLGMIIIVAKGNSCRCNLFITTFAGQSRNTVNMRKFITQILE